jgi:hypothetical protein
MRARVAKKVMRRFWQGAEYLDRTVRAASRGRVGVLRRGPPGLSVLPTEPRVADPARLVPLDDALRGGLGLHTFRSGGGLRVVCVRRREDGDRGTSVAYGEHPYLDVALEHAATDLVAGGRPYGAVYGGTEPHYLTGASESSSGADAWVRQGQTIDAWGEDGAVVADLRGFKQMEFPADVVAAVKETGKRHYRNERGFVFEFGPSEHSDGVSGRVLSAPEGRGHHEAFLYRVSKVGRGPTLLVAVDAALAAPEVEAAADAGRP